MVKAFKTVLVLTCLTSLFFVGCHKKETVEVDNETQSAVDNSVADQEYAAIVPSVQDHAINSKGTGCSRMMSTICDTMTWMSGDTTLVVVGTKTLYATPPTYTMNISSINCPLTMPDGRTRTGSMQIKITGPLKYAGSKMIITMTDYKSSGVSYFCDSIVATTISSNTVVSQFNVKLYKGLCQSSAWSIKYEFDRTITTRPKDADPVAEIYGSANGTNRLGITFAVNIPQATPIVKHESCKYIDKGILELTPFNFKTRTVDFGDGTCDNKATFTVNGSTVAFTLN